MTSRRSKTEEAKALRALKGVTTSDKEFAAIRDTLFPAADPARDRALTGLSQEDEFAILCHTMGTCSHLARLDQSPLVPTRMIVPDYIASFAPGCSVLGLSSGEVNCTYSCFVEVKSDNKQKYRISERDLKRREEFPHHFNLPLVFAIRFTQFEGQAAWLFVTSRQFRSLNRKLDLSQFGLGLGHLLLDDYILAAPNTFDVAYVWDTAAKPRSNRHDQYGSLVELDLYKDQNRVPVPDQDHLFVCALLEAFRPRVLSTATAGSKTTQILRIAGNQGPLLSNIVYTCNQLATDETSGKAAYDPVRITSSFDAEKPHVPLFTRQHIERIAHKYFLNRQLFKLAMGEPKEQLARLRDITKHPLTT